MPAESTLTIAVLLPDLLGTYGDRGNAIVLACRTRWRGRPARILDIPSGTPVPVGADIYLLGGGEDLAQREATELLAASRFPAAVHRGAVVLAVCAGFQLLGASTVDRRGQTHPGLGVLDATTRPGHRRAIGEVTATAAADAGLDDAVLTGFENHRGLTTLGPGTRPLATVGTGTGNGDGADGALTPTVVATYLHGPVLARNPALADRLLALATGAPQPALHVDDQAALRASTLAAAATRTGSRVTRTAAALLPRRWHHPGVPR